MTLDEQSDWRPISQRYQSLREESLFEGVPAHLEMPLAEWARSYLLLDRPGDLAGRVALRLRLALSGRGVAAEELVTATTRTDQLLDVVDTALHLDEGLRWDIEVAGPVPTSYAGIADWVPEYEWPETSKQALEAERLNQILTDAGSAYEFSWNERCLVRRVDKTVSEAAQSVTSGRREAGRHLATAWTSAYGLNPDPSKAYDEAVRAVEAAAIPVVLPKGRLETLGKVRAHLRDAGSKWELAIKGNNQGAVDPVVAMIGLLWDGHARHAGSPSPRRHDQDEARMAIHLAVTLVQWFATGAVRRRPATQPSVQPNRRLPVDNGKPTEGGGG
ncbi:MULTISPECIES: hypothetical protein [Micromonospora]|uniref:hypothetical protein n=1 Tax=Micromonospora TaxID=1873 RepID=UPI000A97671F|nr:hypothetical protein [Micromonospora haikouensis]